MARLNECCTLSKWIRCGASEGERWGVSRGVSKLTFALSPEGRANATRRKKADSAGGVSPDGQWVVAQASVSGEKTPRGIVAYSIRDGSSLRVCYGLCLPSWSPDGRSFNVRWMQTEEASQDDFRTLVIPLQAGQVFPLLPLAGLRSETDVAALKGTTVVDGNISMSPDRGTYAFSRRTVHRNLYRIPIP
jgi:hypothetical protein